MQYLQKNKISRRPNDIPFASHVRLMFKKRSKMQKCSQKNDNTKTKTQTLT